MDKDSSSELLTAVHEIRDLLRLLAEPAIAERDHKLRSELCRIVGKSPAKARAVLLMDGNRTQADIRRETGFHQGNLSTFVKQLGSGNLLSDDGKKPKLAISVPANLFESGVKDE